MSIDVDANPKTGYIGSDYDVQIKWNGTKWIKTVMENSALGHIRPLDVKTNYGDFFDKQRGIVLLSLDLPTINYPKQYLLDFYIKDYLQSKDERNMTLISDYTNWINIPPSDYIVSTSPNSVMLREDETKTVEVSITPIGAATRVQPFVSINVTNKYPDLELKLNPNQTTIQSNSTTTSLLKVTAVKNAAVHPYTFPIQTQIFFP
jgi:uncharacterized protein YqgV (UPF0045/DUF77 family)